MHSHYQIDRQMHTQKNKLTILQNTNVLVLARNVILMDPMVNVLSNKDVLIVTTRAYLLSRYGCTYCHDKGVLIITTWVNLLSRQGCTYCQDKCTDCQLIVSLSGSSQTNIFIIV